MNGPLRMIVGVVGALWLGIAGAWGMYELDRRPFGSPPLIHFKVLFWSVNWPGDSLAARSQALVAAEKALAAHVAAVQAQQASVTTQAAQKERAAQVQIRTLTRYIIKEIPSALPPAVDRAFPLPNGFVRLYNLSIGATSLPDATTGPDDAASPIPISAAAGVIVPNNRECVTDRERLTALQDWITGEQSVTK